MRRLYERAVVGFVHKVAYVAGEVFRLKGLGVPSLEGRGTGSLLVRVVVEVPKKLTPRQEELLRELAEIEEKAPPSKRKSFLDKVKAYLGQE